jgi:hypothetical protein
MVTARRLIAESGTKGMKVTVWGYQQKAEVTRYFAALLRRLGYRTSIRMYPNYLAYGSTVVKPSTNAQIGIDG